MTLACFSLEVFDHMINLRQGQRDVQSGGNLVGQQMRRKRDRLISKTHRLSCGAELPKLHMITEI